MRSAIISDVHANLESLDAVLARIEPGVPLYCLGDTVGYGPDPNACVERVRARATAAVLGNHDVAAVDNHGIELFNPAAREAIVWTQEVLAADNAAWLDGLAYEHRLPGFLLVHGAPVDYFTYILTEETARAAFAATDAPLVFVGHTHVANYYALEPDGTIRSESRRDGGRLELAPGVRYIVNVGSVGQPRDRNPAACFATYDDEARAVEWHRVAYDPSRTQEKIACAHLPASLASRLDAGR